MSANRPRILPAPIQFLAGSLLVHALAIVLLGMVGISLNFYRETICERPIDKSLDVYLVEWADVTIVDKPLSLDDVINAGGQELASAWPFKVDEVDILDVEQQHPFDPDWARRWGSSPDSRSSRPFCVPPDDIPPGTGIDIITLFEFGEGIGVGPFALDANQGLLSKWDLNDTNCCRDMSKLFGRRIYVQESMMERALRWLQKQQATKTAPQPSTERTYCTCLIFGPWESCGPYCLFDPVK